MGNASVMAVNGVAYTQKFSEHRMCICHVMHKNFQTSANIRADVCANISSIPEKNAQTSAKIHQPQRRQNL